MSREQRWLWDAVAKTDPKYTKDFDKGSFKGTATNVVWLCMRATDVLGPVGQGWGWNILKEEQHSDPETGAVMWFSQVQVWWIDPQDEKGTVNLVGPQWGGTQMIGNYKPKGKEEKGRRYFDEDAPKKSVTDALSKSLSYLGFAADVHMGKFDDNKYVNAVDREFAEAQRKERDGDAGSGEDKPGPEKGHVHKGRTEKPADRGEGDRDDKGNTPGKWRMQDVEEWRDKSLKLLKTKGEFKKAAEVSDWWKKLSDLRTEFVAQLGDPAADICDYVKTQAQVLKKELEEKESK